MSTEQESQRIRIAEAEGFTQIATRLGPDLAPRAFGGILTGILSGSIKAVPAYDTIDAIQRAVLAMGMEFLIAFDFKLRVLGESKKMSFIALTAADWCACFIAVLDERTQTK